jgi:molecular chaperone HtpG
VLLLTDPIDEYVVSHLTEYKGKRLKAVDKGDVEGEKTDEQKQKAEQFKPLLDAVKQKLAEVKDVRLSHRLKESAACLVADEYGPTAHMERLMQRLGQGEAAMGSYKRTLELNPDHPAVQKLRQLYEANGADPKLETYAKLLLDQATIAEGSTIKDPAAFAKRVNELIAAG